MSYKEIDADLATVREALNNWASKYDEPKTELSGPDAFIALARVEAELSRLGALYSCGYATGQGQNCGKCQQCLLVHEHFLKEACEQHKTELSRLREERDAAQQDRNEYIDIAEREGARCARLQQALACDHHETAWTFVEYEGATWNRCVDCGLMERWANGTRFDQRVVSDEALAGQNTPADNEHVSVLRADLQLAFGSHPLRDDHTCPVCDRQESAAHYCWPREAARDRLRKAGLDTPADNHSWNQPLAKLEDGKWVDPFVPADDPRCPELNPKSTSEDRCERPAGHSGDHVSVSHSGRAKVYPSKWNTPADSQPRPCPECKSPLACTFRGEVEPGYCLIAKQADSLALNGNPVNAEMAWQIIHRWDALVNVVKAAEERSQEHSVDCDYIQTWDGPTPMKCDCGADALREALAALNEQ